MAVVVVVVIIVTVIKNNSNSHRNTNELAAATVSSRTASSHTDNLQANDLRVQISGKVHRDLGVRSLRLTNLTETRPRNSGFAVSGSAATSQLDRGRLRSKSRKASIGGKPASPLAFWMHTESLAEYG